jgi:hypothetical protein
MSFMSASLWRQAHVLSHFAVEISPEKVSKERIAQNQAGHLS